MVMDFFLAGAARGCAPLGGGGDRSPGDPPHHHPCPHSEWASRHALGRYIYHGSAPRRGTWVIDTRSPVPLPWV